MCAGPSMFVLLNPLLLALAFGLYQFYNFTLPVHILPRGGMGALDSSLLPQGRVVSSRRLFPGRLPGPESLAALGEGRFVTGLEDGRVILLHPESEQMHELGVCTEPNTCGRALGIRPVNSSTVVVADAVTGVYMYNMETGRQVYLLPSGELLDGVSTDFYDDVVLSPEGVLFASHVSDHFGYHNYLTAILKGDRTGRVAYYDLKSGSKGFLDLPQFYFPNGVELAYDSGSLLLNENCAFRTLEASWSPEGGMQFSHVDQFADLPGLPDNIRRGTERNYWVALAGSRNEGLISTQMLLESHFFRDTLARLEYLGVLDLKQLTAKPYGGFAELDRDGEIRRVFTDASGQQFNHVSEVHQIDSNTLILCSFDHHVRHLVQVTIQ